MTNLIKNVPLLPLKQSAISPPPVLRKLYGPLGVIVVTFADLEARLTIAIETLLGTSSREGAALEWLMQNMSNRIELFYFLASQATTPAQELTPLAVALLGRSLPPIDPKREEAAAMLNKEAENLYDELKQANSDRNNLLHGAWTGASRDGSAYNKRRLQAAAGTLKPIPIKGVTLELLKQEANYIMSINLRLADWTMRFRSIYQMDLWPAPLAEKHLLRSPLGKLLRDNKRQVQHRQRVSSHR